MLGTCNGYRTSEQICELESNWIPNESTVCFGFLEERRFSKWTSHFQRGWVKEDGLLSMDHEPKQLTSTFNLNGVVFDLLSNRYIFVRDITPSESLNPA